LLIAGLHCKQWKTVIKPLKLRLRAFLKRKKKAVYSCQANRLALKVARWKGILGMETQKPLPPYIIEVIE